MNIKPIKTDSDYKEALKRMEQIFDAKMGSKESDEADDPGGNSGSDLAGNWDDG